MRFIDSTSIKVSQVRAKIKIINKEYLIFKNGLTTRSHICCIALCQVVCCLSPSNSHDAPVTEEIKLIEPIYPKNINYHLMVQAYKGNETLALAKANGFHSVILPKKIVNHLVYTINNFTNNAIILNDTYLN